MAELNGAPVSPEAWQSLGLINYGHFTSMRAEGQRVRGLSHHMDRLVRDCRAIFDAELDRERVREFMRHALADEQGRVLIRVTVFDPKLELGHPGVTAEPHVLVTTRRAGAWPESPMRVQTVNFRRDLPAVKHIGLFGSVMARRNAQLGGYDDALFIDSDSYISEGVTWNVGFFDGERVVWPNADVLPGVTMRLLKQVHDQAVTAPVNHRDISAMKAVFATNAGVGVRAITAIDNVQFSETHPILKTLRKEYIEIPAERL